MKQDYEQIAKTLTERYKGKRITEGIIKPAKNFRKRTSFVLDVKGEKNIIIECLQNHPITSQLLFFSSDKFIKDPVGLMKKVDIINFQDQYDCLEYLSGGIIDKFDVTRAISKSKSTEYSKPIEELGSFVVNGRYDKMDDGRENIQKLSNAYFLLQVYGKHSSLIDEDICLKITIGDS